MKLAMVGVADDVVEGRMKKYMTFLRTSDLSKERD